MPRSDTLAKGPRLASVNGVSPGNSWCANSCIRLYGWDSPSRTWHGPNELDRSGLPNRRLLRGLRATPGNSWFGPITCCASGEETARFFALVHNLSDCAVASIYCDESKAGPAEIVVVIPADRRAHLREDFAFEFLTFARFLGALSAGTELEVHNAIDAALAEERGSSALAFSLSSGLWPGDLGLILSHCVEQVALTLCRWLGESAGSHPVSAA